MKIKVVSIIVPLVILALALTGGSILMLRLFSASVLVLLLGYIWIQLSIHGIEGQVRKSVERCQVGEWFDEEVTISNRSKLPKLLVRLQENTDLPGHSNMLALNLSPRSSRSWQTKAYCQRRGRYSVGSFTVTLSDPFGLFSSHRNLGEPQSILVYPATLELPFFWPLSHYEHGYGPDRWSISQASPNAARVREYVAGDSLNRIHWPSTAHTGKLMVKEFDPDRYDGTSKDIWIIPDMHQGSQLGDNDEATEEYAITIAASLIKKYLDERRQVGLIASGDKPYLFPPQTGSQHLWRMLEVLALMKATGEVPVDQLISKELKRFGVNSVIIVITPFVNERVTVSLRHLRSRGTTVVALLLDPPSFGGRVNPMAATRSLTSNGIPVYVVRRGKELATVLDSRAFSSRKTYITNVV